MANDGKYLEDMVEDYFDPSISDIWCHRFMDSKAARNLGAKQPADFLVAKKCYYPTLLECKSVKHIYRLPKFVQHNRMVRAGMAGVRGVVLVHHWKIDKYRVINIECLKVGVPSHDLRELCEELDWDEAMRLVI